MSEKLEKFTRDEYRRVIDLYTATSATLDLFIRRYEAQFEADVAALPAGAILDARPDVDGISKEQIQAFLALLNGLRAAQPEGSSDALIAQRVNPLRISE